MISARIPSPAPAGEGQGKSWIGHVLASGYVFDEQFTSREEIIRRLLTLWTDGARLARSPLPRGEGQGEGAHPRWYLVGLKPQRVEARTSPGTPLVWSEGRWLAASFTEAEVRAAPMDAILELVGGTLTRRDFASLTQVHPVELLELEKPRVLETQLLEPPPPPVIRAPAPPQNNLDQVFSTMLKTLNEQPRPPAAIEPVPVPPPPTMMDRARTWLAGVAARRAERARQRREADARAAEQRNRERLARLERERAEYETRVAREREERAERERREAANPSAWTRFTRWLAGPAPSSPRERGTPSAPTFWSRVADFFRGSETPRENTETAMRQLRTQLNEPARPIDPSVWEQLARLLANTRPNPNARRNDAPSFFERLFGPRAMQPTTPEKQKSYLDDLRRRFSEGDLAEALRRAIPLGGTGNATLGNFVPPRRDSLQLLTPNASGGPTMIMPDSEYEQMRKLYREAADKLIAEGRIEEAAYLLAKLLHDAAGGVALLEKHGKLELAAHLAAAQNLPELERIRLWILAGKPEEAIKLVRGNRDFAGLVNGLQTRAPDVARQLRAVWGDYLASRDRYTEAIVATAPLAEPPKAFPQWVDRALETGGVNAATALAIDLGRYPEHADDARRRVDELLANDENSSLTNTTASLLVTHAPKAPGPMYRDLWRRLMTGASRQHRSVERSVAEQVLARTGDAALQADAVPTPTLPAAVERPPLELAAPVVSGLQVFDVAELPKNRRVLAEGAAGLRIVNKDGTTIRQHLVKADALVAGPIGTQVLVISRDGHLTRVWKLHPRSLELTSWFQAQLDCFARRFDGLVWPVGMENALVLLDPATPAPMEWWRVSATHVREVELSGNAPFVVALAKDIGTNQTFRFVFDVGGQRLERRLGPETEASWVGSALATWEVRVAENGVTTLMLVEPKIQLALGPGRRAFLPTKTGLITSRGAGAWCDITHVEWKTGRMRQLARLSRVTQPVLRELTNGLVVCDEFGRVTEL